MPQEIDAAAVHRLVAEGAQLVEVLPQQEYEEQHLPSAVGIPLRKIDQQGHELLAKDRAVIVYCWDSA